MTRTRTRTYIHQEGYISQVLMPAALKWISSALAVVPVRGNLTLEGRTISMPSLE